MMESTQNLSTLMVGEEGHTTTIAGEEDLRAHTETLHNLNPTTLALGEEISSLSLGEEFTTEALGEEGPTTTSGENPSPAEFSREGGPFGAY